MTTILDNKYEVFDYKDSLHLNPFPVGTYFVLRKQDLLAVHALWAYVNVLGTASDLIDDPEEVARLRILADKIGDLADEWERSSKDEKKLPD